MNKSKFFGFAIACIIGLLGISPIVTYAADTKSESFKLSDKGNHDKRAAFDEKMKKANESWKTLTTKQKQEIYELLEHELESKIKIMDKLVKFGVMEKADAVKIKNHMLEGYNKAKNSGEFPLFRQRCRKKK